MFFDSHCHLTDERIFAQLDAILERAMSADVSRILSISVDLDDTAKILPLTDGQRIFASAGVHPASALTWNESSAQRLLDLAQQPHVVAIGECGLDYIYDEKHPDYPGATRERQAEVLEAQLEIAAQLKLPVVIHNREADADTLAIIRNHRERLVGGVFHCFGSGLETAKQVIDLDFHIGFTGIVTFKNAKELQEVATWCPLERILIETDAPYLAPTPHRGKMNEPSFVPHVATKIADLRRMPPQEIGSITTTNAINLFSVK
jgi:TatD DNase family protein